MTDQRIEAEGGQTGTAEIDKDDDDVETFPEVRRPTTPRSPGQPTRREWEEHKLLHWPYRSWCKHCVCGRAIASPHKTKTDEEREERRASGVPTISFDHCFMGTIENEKTAHESPWLICYDDESESMYAVAVPSKSPTVWICTFMKHVIDELGYGGGRVAIQIDGAEDLKKLRREITTMRSAPTVPIDVPIKESKGNGAVENAVRTWQGIFRTIKSQVEGEIGSVVPHGHAILQWAGWWASQIVNRFVVRRHGRSAYEYATGHKTKSPVTCFGEKILWRRKRSAEALNKHDSEWTEGIFIGLTGSSNEVLVSTPGGVVQCRDIRRLVEKDRWDEKFLLKCDTGFEQYVNPAVETPEAIVVHADMPQIDGPTAA